MTNLKAIQDQITVTKKAIVVHMKAKDNVALDICLNELRELNAKRDALATDLPMIDQVHKALLDNVENSYMGTVYLPNVDIVSLGITPSQFSGYCSALSKIGKFEARQDDKFFASVFK